MKIRKIQPPKIPEYMAELPARTKLFTKDLTVIFNCKKNHIQTLVNDGYVPGFAVFESVDVRIFHKLKANNIKKYWLLGDIRKWVNSRKYSE